MEIKEQISIKDLFKNIQNEIDTFDENGVFFCISYNPKSQILLTECFGEERILYNILVSAEKIANKNIKEYESLKRQQIRILEIASNIIENDIDLKKMFLKITRK